MKEDYVLTAEFTMAELILIDLAFYSLKKESPEFYTAYAEELHEYFNKETNGL